jgi:hypothetical protein
MEEEAELALVRRACIVYGWHSDAQDLPTPLYDAARPTPSTDEHSRIPDDRHPRSSGYEAITFGQDRRAVWHPTAYERSSECVVLRVLDGRTWLIQWLECRESRHRRGFGGVEWGEDH